MAHSKQRNQKHVDQLQLKCQNEAKKFVLDYYNREGMGYNPDSLYIVWFAFLPSGWKCMITSSMYKNHFFEVTKHVNSGEMYCNCYNLFEHIVYPSTKPAFVLTEPVDDLLF